MKKKIPYDFLSSLELKDWQKNFASSINQLKLRSFFESQQNKILDYIDQINCQKIKNIYLLIIPSCQSYFNNTLVAAKTLQNGHKMGLDYYSKISEFNFLKNGKKFTEKKIKKKIYFLFFRRVLRTLLWNKWNSLSAFIKPDITAVAHNPLLNEYAKESKKKINYIQAEEFYKKIMSFKNKNITNQKEILKITKNIYKLLLNNYRLQGKYRKRFDKITLKFIKKQVTKSIQDLETFYSYPKFPKNIWTGSASNYLSRLFLIVCDYRGGNSNAFAHSTVPVIPYTKNRMILYELSVSTMYTFISKNSKILINKFLKKRNKPLIICNNKNEPKFINIKLKKKNNTLEKKFNKVTLMYVSGALKDFTQESVLFNSMIYLDWQLKISDLVEKMGIKIRYQPHIEGVFKNKSLQHPLLVKFNQKKDKFENLFNEADIFLTDAPNSTTFGMMMLTNKPIILINFFGKGNDFKDRPELKKIINRRCRVIDVKYNSKTNLPEIPAKELSKALLADWKKKIASNEIESLLLNK